jgi:hypothetical protein
MTDSDPTEDPLAKIREAIERDYLQPDYPRKLLVEEVTTLRTQLLDNQRSLDRLGGLLSTVLPRSDVRLNETEQKIIEEAETLSNMPTRRTELDRNLTRLRARLGLACTSIRSGIEALMGLQYDDEEERDWLYCLVCDDEAVAGERDHRYGPGADTCIVYDLQQTLAHVEGDGAVDTIVEDIGGATLLVRSIEKESNEHSIRAAAGAALLLLDQVLSVGETPEPEEPKGDDDAPES